MKLNLQNLYDDHARNVAKVNDWYDDKGAILYSAFIRAEQLLRLDILIAQYQEKFPTPWTPMTGRAAINHLLFSKTSREPDLVEKVRQIAFPDIFFLLHEDLATVDIGGKALEVPGFVSDSREYRDHMEEKLHIELPPCSEAEWDWTLAGKNQVLNKP
ncbi:TPA: hypothetical protein JDD40_002311 [Salmonella enterica subsp. diarizonae]|nr:hypothetical protein [Salmonella enterica subsp. diarizonae]